MRLNSPQINLITRACMKASRSLIRDFGEIENLQVLEKGPGDFVTSADRRTEKILIDTIKTPLINIFPGLENILFSLFEMLKDIKLFIIDLY